MNGAMSKKSTTPSQLISPNAGVRFGKNDAGDPRDGLSEIEGFRMVV